GPTHDSAHEEVKRRLVDAARMAGFQEVKLLAEPSAALEDEPIDVGTIVAVDFGGGTFDVAVIDMPRRPGEVSGLAGVAVGGEHFDELLFESKVLPALGLKSEYVDATGRQHKMPARVAA